MTNPVVEESMSVRPETVLIIIGVCALAFIVITGAMWIWAKFK